MMLIELSRGQFAKVDDEDFEWLSQWKWYAKPDKGDPDHFSAMRQRTPGETSIMSRLIMHAEKGVLVDHKDHDRLNNQKENLRICNHLQNTQNRRLFKSKTLSKYKGVRFSISRSRDNKNKPWTARITITGRRFYLGAFATEEEAARAYDNMAAEHFGEFACLNLPVVIKTQQLTA